MLYSWVIGTSGSLADKVMWNLREFGFINARKRTYVAAGTLTASNRASEIDLRSI